MQNIKTRRGYSSAMHWRVKSSWLNPNLPFLPRLRARSLCKPSWSNFCYCTVDSSFYAAPVHCARLLHCVEVCSLMLAAIWLLKNLGFFPSAPLLTLSRREWISLSWHCHGSHYISYLLLLLAHSPRWQGRAYATFAHSCQTVYGGRTSFRLAGKLQLIFRLSSSRK